MKKLGATLGAAGCTSQMLAPVVYNRSPLEVLSRFTFLLSFFPSLPTEPERPLTPAHTLFSDAIQGVGPVTPVTRAKPGLPTPPHLPTPASLSPLPCLGSVTAGGVSCWPPSATFSAGVLPPLQAALANCLSLTRIVREILSVKLYLSGHRCLPPWQAPVHPAVP